MASRKNPWTDESAREQARSGQPAPYPPSNGKVYRNTYSGVLCRVEWVDHQSWRMVNLETGGTRHTFYATDDERAFRDRYVPAEQPS